MFFSVSFIRCVVVILIGSAMLFLSGCADRYPLAPVVGLDWGHSARVSRYVVHRGDTLYSIAFRYDKDYRQLAVLNHLRPPYLLSVGQVIVLQPPSQWERAWATIHPHQAVKKTSSSVYPQYRRRFFSRWSWPARGRVVSIFSPAQGKKGIDIAGQRGAKIFAAKNGVVAYSGSGLENYGNLIIIRHDNQYLTAYANNARNLVREGQIVKKGQVIAEMGIINHRFYGVHFEIRQAGRPINPLNYL